VGNRCPKRYIGALTKLSRGRVRQSATDLGELWGRTMNFQGPASAISGGIQYLVCYVCWRAGIGLIPCTDRDRHDLLAHCGRP